MKLIRAVAFFAACCFCALLVVAALAPSLLTSASEWRGALAFASELGGKLGTAEGRQGLRDALRYVDGGFWLAAGGLVVTSMVLLWVGCRRLVRSPRLSLAQPSPTSRSDRLPTPRPS